MSGKEKFIVSHGPEKDEATFVLEVTVGTIGTDKSVRFVPSTMVHATQSAIMNTISKRPTKNRRDWEDKVLKLLDAHAYWSMMEKLGFTTLPITAVGDGKYEGHPLCDSSSKEVVDNAS